jgi:hypothetical protein
MAALHPWRARTYERLQDQTMDPLMAVLTVLTYREFQMTGGITYVQRSNAAVQEV